MSEDSFEEDGLVSVYDGRDCIGRVRPGKSGGFIAMSETGIELGIFEKRKQAARAVFDARRAGADREVAW